MRELGEFALIERINAGRVQTKGVLLGPGDDAALIAAPDGRFVVSTDMLVQGRHFRLDWSSPRDIGGKAIAQNAADVVAMGAVPSAFVVALGCPADTPLDFVDGLADGMWAEAARAGASIAGGDLVRSTEIVLSVTAFGDLHGRPAITRSGARVGDTVAVAGRLGWSAAGLDVLSRGIEPTDDLADALAAHRVPRPPYGAVLDALADTAPHALTDVSDGLLADLGHMSEASGVAIDLDSAALADTALAALAATLDADAAQWILTGGEDHAFAAAWPPGRALPAGWVPIGRVCAGHGVTVDGIVRPGTGGWESFSGADSAPAPGPR
ncbi:thiamine-phosphate kinase [Nocardia sp. NPDC052566]|uniref:thiamine-phosphate kinase n=1 Tax=Nocardia sp. NPDC052566 TaxID=3364330 RepID=UPI0037CBCA87